MLKMDTEKKKHLQFNPLDITESLGYTTFRRDSRKPWTREEDIRLSELIDTKLREMGFGDGIQSLTTDEWSPQSANVAQDINWDEISEKLQTRKSKDCRKRWTNSLDPNLKKGKWTPEEDELLVASFQKHGSSWQKISLEIPGRTDDQCAKRYIEVLDPNTKDRLRTWSLEEDLNLIKKVKSYGTKWRTISLEMQSRPSLTCRNRWRKIVTDVVRGKANPLVKKEIDSIEGGLSKLEEISESLQKQKKEVKTKEKKSKLKPEHKSHSHILLNHIPEISHAPQLNDSNHTQHILEENEEPIISELQTHISNGQSSAALGRFQHVQASLTGIGSPSYAGVVPPGNNNDDPPKPTSTEMDWKYTLKDTTGLTLSNGNISSSELAKNLIENAKKYSLKISIHQHIHHHYAQTSTSKIGSPDDSTSNVSGANTLNEELTQPNRYSHFNYLSPMVQPQLESSNLGTQRDSDLTKILNPSAAGHQYQTTSSKRRLSASSNNSRNKHLSPQFYPNSHPNNPFNHEELEDELDFWETMRSLSQVVNTEQAKGDPAMMNHKKSRHSRRRSSGSSKNKHTSTELGLYYPGFGDEGDLDLEELDLKDLGGFAGLPFNPS